MSPQFRPILAAFWVALVVSTGGVATAVKSGGDDDAKRIPVADVHRSTPVDFEKEVLPILNHSCLACHNRSKAKAKLVLETPADILKGGDSGPAAVPRKAAISLLLKAAEHAPDVDSPMPPPHNSVRAADLTPEQLGLIRLWIDQGATGEVRGTTAQLKWVALAPVVQPVYAVAVTPDGQFVACGRGNRVDVYQLNPGRLVAHLVDPALGSSSPSAAHRDLVESLAFSPDGTILASGSYREIKLWRRPVPLKKWDLAGTGAATQCAAISPDRKRIAVGDDQGRIRLFDASNGASIGELVGHDAAVTALSFSAKGDRLASTSVDRTCRVWDIGRQQLACKTEAPCELRAVTWTGGDKCVAGGGTDGVIRLWRVPNTESEMPAAGELEGHEGPVNALARTSDEKQIISGGEDGTLRIWEVGSGHVIRVMKHGSAVTAVAVRTDGKRLASTGRDNAIKLWKADGPNAVTEIKGDPALLADSVKAERSLSLATAEIPLVNAQVAAARKDVAAQAERLQKAHTALTTANHDVNGAETALSAAKAARDGVDTRIAARHRAAEAVARAEEVVKSMSASFAVDDKAADSDQKTQIAAAASALKAAKEALSAMKLEDARKSAEAAVAKASAELSKATAAKTGAEQEVTSATQSAAAADAVLVRATAGLKLAEAARARREAELMSKRKAYANSARPFRSLAFSPDGTLLAAGCEDGTVQTICSDTGKTADLFGHLKAPVCGVAFADSSTLLTIAGREGGACAWDLAPPWKLERTLGSAQGASPIADRVTSLDFSPDGRVLASGGGVPSRGGEIKLWDLASVGQVRTFDQVHSDTVTCVRFSPDGNRLACASSDRFVRVIDVTTGKIILALEGHQHHVLGVAWRADGHTIATAGADSTLRFWNADTGERKTIVSGFDKEVTGVCFVGDGDLALAASGDGTVKMFRENGSLVRSFPWPGGFVYAATVTSDGQTVVGGGENGVMRAWAANSGQIVAEFRSGGPLEPERR